MKYLLLLSVLLSVAYGCDPPYEEIGGSCLLYSGSLGVVVISYEGATRICGDFGGSLAKIRSDQQNIAVIQHMRNENILEDKVLLGATLNENGDFEWVDGSAVDVNGWAIGQPSRDGACMGYSAEHNLLWDDFICEGYDFADLLVGFWCEYLPLTTTSTTSTTNRPTTTSITTLPTTTSTTTLPTTTSSTTTTTKSSTTSPSTTTTFSPTTTETTTTVPTTTTTTSTTTTTAEECRLPFVDLVVGCFYFLDQTDDFETAHENCQSVDAHLAYVDSLEKQLALEVYIEEFEGNPWIGAYDTFSNDTFYWLDGVALEGGYTNLGNLSGEDHNGLAMVRGDNFQWNDFPLESERPSICEKY